MRLSLRNLKKAHLRQRIVSQDDEANDIVDWGPSEEILLTVRDTGGSLDLARFGEQLRYIKSCKYQGDMLMANRNEGDGVCLYVKPKDEPDYQIISISNSSFHKDVTLKKRVTDGTGYD